MKTLEISQMEQINGGTEVPKWLQCTGAVLGTAIFLGGIFATTGPVGLYAANAIFGPTVVGLGWAACAS